MPNYTLAEHAKMQTIAVGKFQSNEMRFRDPVLWKMLVRNGVTMIENYQTAKDSIDRVIEMNFKNRTSRALGGTVSHDHSGDQGDSSIVTPTWVAYTDEFVSTLKEANNKIWTPEELFINKLENLYINFSEGLEAVSSAFLFSSRTQVGTSAVGATWDPVDYVYKIDETTNGTRAISIMKVIMDLAKYQGTAFDVVFDPISWVEFESQINQGTSNATNTAYQFNGVNFLLDPDLTAAGAGLIGAYDKGVWLAIPQGMAGSMPWIDQQQTMGVETTVNTYTNAINPVDGVKIGIHTYETRINGESLGGQVQDVGTELQATLYASFEVAPDSTAGASPVTMFVLT